MIALGTGAFVKGDLPGQRPHKLPVLKGLTLSTPVQVDGSKPLSSQAGIRGQFMNSGSRDVGPEIKREK